MTNSEARKILAKVSLSWPHQPTDELTEAEWREALEAVDYADAYQAVQVLRDSGREYAPHAGIVKTAASDIRWRREQWAKAERERDARSRLIAVSPALDEAQRQRGLRVLREAIARLSRRFSGVTA